MPKTSGANLYKDAARWPVMPPWWLLSSPQAAALINVTPATLHMWRTRGEGPPAVPPLFLKPAQGIQYFTGTAPFVSGLQNASAFNTRLKTNAEITSGKIALC